MADSVAGGKTAALPRSLLHLRFLIDNGADPDIILYRDETLGVALDRAFPGRSLYLGRETLPGRSPAGFLAARKANRAYYSKVAATIQKAGIGRLILFLEGEPLERLLVRLPGIAKVELWEDGLSHYIDLTSHFWYVARSAVQALAGFYPKQIWRRRMDRRGVLVRDRFEQGNLTLLAPAEPCERREEVLLIGSPLVEDGIADRARFIAALSALEAASTLPVRYLPHPRERVDELAAVISNLSGTSLEPNPNGLMDHASRFGYSAYLAALSTGLLDLQRFERSLFVPGLFGQPRMGRILSAWPACPVRVARDEDEVRAFLDARTH